MSETKLSATETEIVLLRRDASWAATHRSELADLRSAFEYAEKKIAAAEEMAKALDAFVEAWDKSHQLEKTDVARRMALVSLAAWNALK